MKHTPRSWTTTVLNARDGSSDAIIQFPDDLLEYLGWKEGDILDLNVKKNVIVITKKKNENPPAL